ncbi:hypothetical protein PVL29_022094 [Vitis rotundifolia]|uniref:AB hydrolase-1 domain-containing protein n=1 Tax=Vitis rotundifolia TaxID=103349 RepID=A0AA38YUI2_VITRO|nr:hypothetical protein PVL29_022094 [Vitis rotundifolia]
MFPEKMALRHSEPVCFSHFCPARFRSRRLLRVSRAGLSVPRLRPQAVLVAAVREAPVNKPSVCTADELHRVAVADSDWSLALWRYTPSPKAERRNHPLLLLSGIGTNAIGFDLAPESSFARYLSNQGFDTWILELRGAGLSTLVGESREVKKPFKAMSDRVGTNGVLPAEAPSTVISGTLVETFIPSVKGKRMVVESDDAQSVSKLSETSTHLFQKLSRFLNEGVFEERQNFSIASQIRDLSGRHVNIIKEGQWTISPPLFDLKEGFLTLLDDFQKQLDLILKYNWDFDHHMKEDVPAAMEYIRTLCKPKDGKLLAIGHSMGGILLYAMLSQSGTVPSKLLLQLTTAFQEGGLRDRDGTFFYKHHLRKSNVPVLAIAGDRDRVCPPEAVYETVKHIPGNLVAYKVFGEPDGPHYGHYDLVGGPSAADQVHPCLSKFLIHHDMA